MKNLETILKQEPVYLHQWKTKIDVISDFEDIYSGNEFANELKEFLGI